MTDQNGNWSPPQSWPPPQSSSIPDQQWPQQQWPQQQWPRAQPVWPPQPPPPATTTPTRGPDRSSVLLVITNTVAVALVVVIAVVSWGWLKNDLSSLGAPAQASSPTPTATPTSSETPRTNTTTQPAPSSSRPTSPRPAGPTNVPPAGVPKVDWGPLPPPNSTDRDRVTLQQHAIYDQPIPAATCTTLPNPVPSGAAFRALANALVDCEYRRWQPTVEAIGLTYPRPSVVFFSGNVTSDCGTVRGSEVSFYCSSGSGTIYLHTNLVRQSREGLRLRLPETVAHEFFHHVQASTGLLEAGMRLIDGGMNADEASRRIELQASCISSRVLATTKGWNFTRSDYNAFLRWYRAGGQDSEHGSAASNEYWGRRGFSMVLVGGCNTWTVPASRVS